MDFDLNYYSAEDLFQPLRPSRPILEKTPTSKAALEFANELQEYENRIAEYNQQREENSKVRQERMLELEQNVRDQYGLTQAQFNVLWEKAWDDGHSEGLGRVLEIFDDLDTLVSEFNSAKLDVCDD